MEPASPPRASCTVLTLALTVTALLGCAETYCQSGPKYGTQCYDLNALEHQETQVRGETISERYVAGASHPRVGAAGPTPPSPGCTTLEHASGISIVSDACTSRRQPAHGAIR
jgi:hypothetical protein